MILESLKLSRLSYFQLKTDLGSVYGCCWISMTQVPIKKGTNVGVDTPALVP